MNDQEFCQELMKRAEEYQKRKEREFAIAELEKIKEELLKKVWRDAQGQIVTRDGFNHGIITSTDIIDKHISELKGENKIHLNFTNEEMAKEFIDDVKAVKDLLPRN